MEKPQKMSKMLFRMTANAVVENCLTQSNTAVNQSVANKDFANQVRSTDPALAEVIDRVAEAQSNLCKTLREARAYVIERIEPQRG